MASADGHRAAPKPYFCHQCSRTVSISISPSSDIACPLCHGGFIEECQSPSPSPSAPVQSLFSDPFSSSFGLAGFPLVFSPASGGFDLHQHPSDPSQRPTLAADPDSFNPFLFLQNHLQNLMAGGANIQFIVDSSPDASGGGAATSFRLPANLGDYFLGPGLEQLIQQIAENDPNRYGTPPAAKSAVAALPDVNVTKELLASDSAQCAVCMEMFDLGAVEKQMPCKHIFHRVCILPWLELHNSCPVCRFELPTDDREYENRVRAASIPPAGSMADQASSNSSSGSAGGSAGQVESEATAPAERRFRITLPWPISMFRSGAETSNSSSRNDNDGNQNQRASDDPVSGPGAMQEDLD